MVNPPGAEAWASSTFTGSERSKPPPATTGSPLTGSGALVEEMGVPDGGAATDWSNPETLDRQG